MSSTKLNDPIKTVLITGGTGLVGSTLSRLLLNKGYHIIHLSRHPTQKHYQTFYWDVKNQLVDEEAIAAADAIIHLAGAGVADHRWTKKWKEEIYNSRIYSTLLLREKVQEYNPGLIHFISASAIGYYGWDTGSIWVDEQSPRGEGFLAKVVDDWEQEVDGFRQLDVKVSKVRIGIVLSERGGALRELAKPIQWGLGAPLGSGNQYMSWIHIQDLCAIFHHILDQGLDGTYNAVAPTPKTNRQFTQAVAARLNRPLWLPNVPKFALRLIVGEMSDILIGGNRVSCKKMVDTGFNFQYGALDQALQDLLR